MFIVQIAGVEASRHTQQCDAEAQKQRFIDGGTDPDTITVVQQ